MDIKTLEARRQSILGNEEWSNFTSMIDDVRTFFNPDGATLRSQVAKGTKLNQRRVSDLGISMKNDYASGVLSEMITSGDQWFEYADTKKDHSFVKMLRDITCRSYDAVNSSNFHTEMHREELGAACDGTTCMSVERVKGKLNFIYVPFGSFCFVQDYRGRPDIVWVEKKTTAGALVGEFGENKVSDKCKQAYDNNPDTEVTIVHYCAPRKLRDDSKKDAKNKAYELLTYEKDSAHPLEEGGTDLQKYIIYRVKRIGNESLGRGPCIDTACSMAAVERSSKEYEKCARLAGVPIFGIGASMGQNGFRWVNQENASLLVYNDTGISGPPQTMNPNTNPEFILKYIELVVSQMRQLFFLDYFNPLENKRNMTLGEAKERVSKASQMVDQIVGPLIEECLNPLLQWVFILLGEAGEFSEHGSWQEIQKKLHGRVSIRYKSRLANAQKRVKLMADLEYLEYMMMVAQGIPDPIMQYEFLVRTDFSEVPEEIREGTNASKILLRDPKEAKAMAGKFAQAMAKQAENENMVKLADAASKGGARPEQGSLTSLALGGQ